MTRVNTASRRSLRSRSWPTRELLVVSQPHLNDSRWVSGDELGIDRREQGAADFCRLGDDDRSAETIPGVSRLHEDF